MYPFVYYDTGFRPSRPRCAPRFAAFFVLRRACSFDWPKKCVRLSAGALTAKFRAILQRFCSPGRSRRSIFDAPGFDFRLNFQSLCRLSFRSNFCMLSVDFSIDFGVPSRMTDFCRTSIFVRMRGVFCVFFDVAHVRSKLQAIDNVCSDAPTNDRKND